MEKRYIENTLVSIITPVYNAEKFIEETIQSVQNQTYKEWEMIIVDDCSCDNSEIIIKDMQERDSRIKYIRLRENSGAAMARNVALENSNGRYIAFLDSDDLWANSKLEEQIRFMNDKKCGFTFTSYEFINEDGSKLDKIVKIPEQIDYNELLKNTIICCSTVVIDRNLVGEFRMILIRKGQDVATWLKILKYYKFAYGINNNLLKYRLVKGSLSRNKLGVFKKMWTIYRNIEKLTLIKSIHVFTCYSLNAIKKRI